jgi:phosphoribosyl-ATP pyrophosphohydrolase
MTIEELYQIIENKKNVRDENSYVSSLFQKGRDRIAQKIGEEATEVVIAVKNRRKKEIIEETADLWFHSLIMLSSLEITPKDVFDELERRKK